MVEFEESVSMREQTHTCRVPHSSCEGKSCDRVWPTGNGNEVDQAFPLDIRSEISSRVHFSTREISEKNTKGEYLNHTKVE